jgi:hypothetical protein
MRICSLIYITHCEHAPPPMPPSPSVRQPFREAVNFSEKMVWGGEPSDTVDEFEARQVLLVIAVEP